jgi:uncharacterized LabA/DUF88 family protein
MDDAAFFIDNSNFYHSLKTARRLPFTTSDYDALFAKLSQQFKLNLKKIFIYDAIKDVSKEPEKYISQQRFHAGIRSLSTKWPITLRTRKLRYRAKDKVLIAEEKGIDVMLAVDAISTAVEKNHQNIIILSGDADYVPAVEFMNKLGVTTINMHLYSGSSIELRNICNKHILIHFKDSEIMLKGL